MKNASFYARTIIDHLHGIEFKKLTHKSCGQYIAKKINEAMNSAYSRGCERGKELKALEQIQELTDAYKKEIWLEVYDKGYEDGQNDR